MYEESIIVKTVPQFPSVDNPSPQEHTMAELLTVYEQDVLPDLGSKSRPYYTWLIRRFERDLGALPLPAVTPTVLRGWIHTLRQDHSVATVRTYVAVLSAILALQAQTQQVCYQGQ
jgi:hypothetical protein